MIIRGSPLSKRSEPEASWPPKSPHEALLSSPSGQKALQRARHCSASPTPSKRRKLSEPGTEDELPSDDDEDEETLTLKLKALQAQLKLKKLQNAKKKGIGRHPQHYSAHAEDVEATSIEVPLSPKAQRYEIQAPDSPRRVQLGIDKGLKAKEVSLKKAFLKRSETAVVAPKPPPKSFGERLAEVRIQDRQKHQKQQRTETIRSKGFVSQPSSDAGADRDRQHRATTTANVHSASSRLAQSVQSSTSVQEQNSASSKTKTGHQEHGSVNEASGFMLSRRALEEAQLSNHLAGKTVVSVPQLLKDVTAPDYDLPDFPTEDFVVVGIIASKSSPHDHSATSEDKAPDKARAKFMAITLTDLQWSLDLYLFDTGFSRFWKLTVGTVIAILNPGIMPPKPQMRDTGRFSLKLSSSEDTVLEIGMAQDLGFCKSIKKNGKECAQWLDKRKTEFCDFHVNLAIEKTTSGRMEINGMSSMGLFGMGVPGAKSNGKAAGLGGHAKRRPGQDGTRGRAGPKREGEYYDRHLRETAFIVPPEFSGGASTARLLDGEDHVQGALSVKERSRKRLADREKERELSQKLAEAGNGLGVEYMKVKGRGSEVAAEAGSKENQENTVGETKQDAAGLGLVGTNAASVRLSPSKGGRRRTGEEAQPMGWGGALKRDLLSPSRKIAKSIPAVTMAAKPRDDARSSSATGSVSSVAARMRTTGQVFIDDDDDDGLDII